MRDKVLTIEEIQRAVVPIAEKYGVERVYLFGSYARGDATPDSDVDLRTEGGNVDGAWMANLFKDDVAAALGIKVDATKTTENLEGTAFLARITGDEVLLHELGKTLYAPVFIPPELRRLSFLSLEKRDEIYLKRIITSCKEVSDAIEYFAGDLKKYDNLPVFRNSVCMAIFQVGEIAGKLSDNFVEKNPQLPWRKMKDMRNILAHEYYYADSARTWDVATIHIPELLKICKEILESENINE